MKTWGWRSYLWLGINVADVVVTLCASYANVTIKVPFVAVARLSLLHYEANPIISWLALSPHEFVAFKVIGSLIVLLVIQLTAVKPNKILDMLNYPMIVVVMGGVAAILRII